MAVFNLVKKAIITWYMIQLLYTASPWCFISGMLLAFWVGSEEGRGQPSFDLVLFIGVAVASKHVQSLPYPHEDMLDTYALSLAALYVALGDRLRVLLLGAWLHYFYMDTDFRKCWAYSALAMVVLMFSHLRRAYQKFWPPVSASLYNSIVFSGLCAYVVRRIESLTPSQPPPPSPPPPPTLTMSLPIITANIEPSEMPMPAMVDSSTQSSIPARSPTMANSSVQTTSPRMTNSGVQTSSPTMTDSSVQTYLPTTTDCSVQTSSPATSNASMQTSSPAMVNNGVQTNSLIVADDNIQTRPPKVVGRSIQKEKDSPIKPCCSRKTTTTKCYTSRSGIMNRSSASGIPLAKRRDTREDTFRICRDLRRTCRTSAIPNEPVELVKATRPSTPLLPASALELPPSPVLSQPLSLFPSLPPSTVPSLPSSPLSSAPPSPPSDLIESTPLSLESLCEPEIAPPEVSAVEPDPEPCNVSMDASAPIPDDAEPTIAVEPAPLMTTVSPSAEVAPIGSTSPLPIGALAPLPVDSYPVSVTTCSLAPIPEQAQSWLADTADPAAFPPQAQAVHIWDWYTSLPLDPPFALDLNGMVCDTQAETDFIFDMAPTDTEGDSAMEVQLTEQQAGPAMGNNLIQRQEIPAMGDGSMQWQEQPTVRMGFGAYRDNTDAESDDGNHPRKPTGSHFNNEDEDFFVPKAIDLPVKIEDFPQPPKSEFFDRIDEEGGDEDKENRNEDDNNKGGGDIQMHDTTPDAAVAADAVVEDPVAAALFIIMRKSRSVRRPRRKACVSKPFKPRALKIEARTDLCTKCREVPWVRHRSMNKRLKRRMVMNLCTRCDELSGVRYRSMRKRLERLRRQWEKPSMG